VPALRDLIGVEQAVRKMEQVNKHAGIPLFHPSVEGLRVQLWLAQGNLARALDWAEHTPTVGKSSSTAAKLPRWHWCASFWPIDGIPRPCSCSPSSYSGVLKH
jgi:hypothetical protein